MRNEKILAVDDDALNLAIMEELLASEYDLTTARSGEEALEVAERTRPDLVLLDIMMPGLDGYEVCRLMRVCESLKHTKVILISAKAMVSERLRGYAAGADDYITKPFDHAELMAKIRVFLRLKFMEEMDALKTEFLVLVAHETRTPLSKLLLMAEMLTGETPIQLEERQRIAGMMQDTAEQLRFLFDRGLQYCILRAGQAKFRRGSIDLEEILGKTVIELKEKARLVNVSLEQTSTGPAPIESDPEKAQLVLLLLLESALERGGRGCRLRAELTGDESAVRLCVRGPGRMDDPNSVHLLAEPFRSPDLQHHSSIGGFNLPLAAETMRHLQGDLTLDLLADGDLAVVATFPRSVDPSNPEWAEDDEGNLLAA